MQDFQLRILSLNCWGLKWVSKHREERLNAIGDYLASCSASTPSSDMSATSDVPLNTQSKTIASYDVVCLQEVWVRSDGDMLKRKARESGLIYARRFHSCDFSIASLYIKQMEKSYPILSSKIYRYPLNGNPLHVIEGDWYVGKAAASAVIDLGEAGIAEVFNTHFYSSGDQWPDEWRKAHRLSQAWELAHLANNAADKGRHVFVCGDLNSIPSSLVIKLMASQGSLADSWTCSQPSPISQPSSPVEAIQRNGMTCDSPINSFSAGKNIQGQTKADFGKRLDYIFFRASPLAKAVIECINTKVSFTELVPGASFSYSDHFGIEASFKFTSDGMPPTSIPTLLPRELESVISGMQMHAKHTAKNSRFYLQIFVTSALFGLVVLPIAASFQPLKYLNWIFTYLGVGSGVLGATMLYVGFVGGRWEHANLQNAIDEMEVELARMQLESGKSVASVAHPNK